MNSKGEWNGSRVPRVVIEVGARTMTTDYDGSQPTQCPQRTQPQSQPQQPGSVGPRAGASVVTVVPVHLGEEQERQHKIREWEADVRRTSKSVTRTRQDKRRDFMDHGPGTKRTRAQPEESIPPSSSSPVSGPTPDMSTSGQVEKDQRRSGPTMDKVQVQYGATDIRYRSMDQVLMAEAKRAASLASRTQKGPSLGLQTPPPLELRGLVRTWRAWAAQPWPKGLSCRGPVPLRDKDRGQGQWRCWTPLWLPKDPGPHSRQFPCFARVQTHPIVMGNQIQKGGGAQRDIDREEERERSYHPPGTSDNVLKSTKSI